MSDRYLPLPFTKPPLNLNQRWHWSRTAREKKQVGHDVGWMAKHHKLPTITSPVFVELTYYPGNNRRMDADNLAPTLKAVLDGLVSAGVLTDDSHQYVRHAATRIVSRDADPIHSPDPRCVLAITETANAHSH